MVKHIRHTSTARARQLREYRKVKEAFLESKLACFSCFSTLARDKLDLHHFYGRTGRLLMWTPGFRCVCAKCHDLIHRNPSEAKTLGLIGPLGTWNDYNRAVAHYEANK